MQLYLLQQVGVRIRCANSVHSVLGMLPGALVVFVLLPGFLLMVSSLTPAIFCLCPHTCVSGLVSTQTLFLFSTCIFLFIFPICCVSYCYFPLSFYRCLLFCSCQFHTHYPGSCLFLPLYHLSLGQSFSAIVL